MADAALLWGGDMAASATGDIAVVVGDVLGQQRLLRRLLTNPGDYLWQPNYGAGLAQFVGLPANIPAIKAAIRSQVFMESNVARAPEPKINVQITADGGVFVQILYYDAFSLSGQTLSFSVGV